ncbi:MAG: hypothetical protein KGL39_29785 [Patescibacteria group bacterium]|nr:hypothetical protein [Patescibacteria group bacterium]
MIPALGNTAFDPRMTPFTLYSAAASSEDEEMREGLEDFARDLAAIQDLPETRSS